MVPSTLKASVLLQIQFAFKLVALTNVATVQILAKMPVSPATRAIWQTPNIVPMELASKTNVGQMLKLHANMSGLHVIKLASVNP
jgi:hypothetical protein